MFLFSESIFIMTIVLVFVILLLCQLNIKTLILIDEVEVAVFNSKVTEMQRTLRMLLERKNCRSLDHFSVDLSWGCLRTGTELSHHASDVKSYLHGRLTRFSDLKARTYTAGFFMLSRLFPYIRKEYLSMQEQRRIKTWVEISPLNDDFIRRSHRNRLIPSKWWSNSHSRTWERF